MNNNEGIMWYRDWPMDKCFCCHK